MKSSQIFDEMLSYIGSDIAEIGFEDDRPPRSAKFVVSLDMGSGPGGGDYRTYLLCTDKTRSYWNLWMEYSGHGQYCQIAWGEPYRGIPAERAAELLLTKSWEDERDLEGLYSYGKLSVEESGLLTAMDIHRIERGVFESAEDGLTRCMADVSHVLMRAQSSLEEVAEITVHHGFDAIECVSTVSKLLDQADQECVKVIEVGSREWSLGEL
jgi:hypothetical protein